MFESLFFFSFPLYSSSWCYHLALERLSEKKTNFGRRVWWYSKIVRNKALRKIYIYIYGMRHGGASLSVNIAQQLSRLLEWKLRVCRLWMKKQAAFVNSCKMVWTNRLRSFEEIERKRGYCERMFVVNWNERRPKWMRKFSGKCIYYVISTRCLILPYMPLFYSRAPTHTTFAGAYYVRFCI